MSRLIFILLALIPLFTRGQVLLEINNNNMYAERAVMYQQAKVKRTWYTIQQPFLLSMEIPADKKGKAKSEWAWDTITYSTYYSTNGFIERETEKVPGDESYYVKEYFFDAEGNLLRTLETNNRRLRYYDHQEIVYNYQNGQLISADKVRSKSNDTTKTTTRFTYTLNKLENVIEKNAVTGDTLLSSYITYNAKPNYIEEKSFEKEWAEVRTSYYYLLNDKGRIYKYTNGLKGFPKNRKAYKPVSYDYGKEIPNSNSSFFKIEKYDP